MIKYYQTSMKTKYYSMTNLVHAILFRYMDFICFLKGNLSRTKRAKTLYIIPNGRDSSSYWVQLRRILLSPSKLLILVITASSCTIHCISLSVHITPPRWVHLLTVCRSSIRTFNKSYKV